MLLIQNVYHTWEADRNEAEFISSKQIHSLTDSQTDTQLDGQYRLPVWYK